MTIAVKVEGLGKRYVIRHGRKLPYATLRESLTSGASAFGRSFLRSLTRAPTADRDATRDEFWALRDVDFEVHAGERVGIIGRNGAGKSTLLKILSRITEPTRGRVAIRGRVASLLEVGTGFHPELTGRENVFLNGAILGMSRAETRRKFDEIVAFAEVERFLDTPVKHYSSGMYVKLAFAVAAHLDPEIMIVDEVLAVGDHRFQRKCLGKMAEVGKSGRTVLFVSHNMNAIVNLCNRVIWIEGGRIAADRAAREAVGDYLNQGAVDTTTWMPATADNARFAFNRIEVLREPGAPAGDEFAADAPLHILFDYTVNGELPPGRLAFTLVNEEGLVVLASASTDGKPALDAPWSPGPATERCTIGAHLLPPGRYFLTVSEPAPGRDRIHERILSFRVGEIGSLVSRDGRKGVVAPLLHWTCER